MDGGREGIVIVAERDRAVLDGLALDGPRTGRPHAGRALNRHDLTHLPRSAI